MSIFLCSEVLDYLAVSSGNGSQQNVTSLNLTAFLAGLTPDQWDYLETSGHTRQDIWRLLHLDRDRTPELQHNMHIKSYEEKLMQFEEYKTHKLLRLYIPPIFIVLGTIGNILSFLVLVRPAMRKVSTYNYLAVLSVADTLVLYIGLLRMWIGELTGYDLQDHSDWACKVINVMGYTVSDYSVWLIISVTVERYIAVVWPLKTHSMCNGRRALRVVLGILLLLFLINAHFFWTTEIVYQKVDGEVVPECDDGEGYRTLVHDIWPWVDAFIYSFVPFVVITILNSMIIWRVMQAKRERHQMATAPRQDGGRRAPSEVGETTHHHVADDLLRLPHHNPANERYVDSHRLHDSLSQ